MFQIRRKPPRDAGTPADAMEWWERSSRRDDLGEQIMQLTEQLHSSLARVDRCERPVFLRALGRDLDRELQGLLARISFGASESRRELTKRVELLEDWVDYFYDATVVWTPAARAAELSDCAREAVAALSGDMVLVLQVQGESAVPVDRRRLISLCELAIRAATADADSEVGVVLPDCPKDHAELRVQWTRTAIPAEESHDRARFLALAVAYVFKLGGTLRRTAGVQEGLVVRIPLRRRSDDEVSATPAFDSEVVAQVTAFCA